MNLILENKENTDLDKIYELFLSEFMKDNLLTTHRLYIEKNNLGYGERPFHVLWRELVKLQNKEFNFLEIGVYKGQVLSLIKLLSNHFEKKVNFYGVSPLNDSGDKFSTYQKQDYKLIIKNLFKYFNLEFDEDKNLICGSSTDEKIKNKIDKLKHFDLVYIDGCHDYDCVVSDLKLVKKIIKIGGYMVLDDSSCFKQLTHAPNRFKGHIDVCKAIQDDLESDKNYEEIICVGHNRVFKKIS